MWHNRLEYTIHGKIILSIVIFMTNFVTKCVNYSVLILVSGVARNVLFIKPIKIFIHLLNNGIVLLKLRILKKKVLFKQDRLMSSYISSV